MYRVAPVARVIALVVQVASPLALAGCTGGDDPAKPDAPAKPEPSAAAEPSATTQPAVDADTPPPSADGSPVAVAQAVPEATPEPKPELVIAEPAAPDEVAIQPWSTTAGTRSWTLIAEPSQALTLVDLRAGVLAQAGSDWFQLGEGDVLEAVATDIEAKPPILGSWPSDAWFVDQRLRNEGDESEEYIELRLMKLRAGKRWVPQVFSGGGGEQWFHPGTDEEFVPHISTRSGMLVWSNFDAITRVAGSYDDPVVGPHRGEVIGFVESGSGKIYVISRDGADVFVQTECADEACVAEQAKKLPLTDWSFGRQVPRGRFSVSLVATSGTREFVLHQRGKSDGWLLDELPSGERPTGMWASDEGGLWTLTGSTLRWRDTDSAWHDIALPEGLGSPSLAVTEDGERIIVAGLVGGATKLYATHADAEAPAPAAAPAP